MKTNPAEMTIIGLNRQCTQRSRLFKCQYKD